MAPRRKIAPLAAAVVAASVAWTSACGSGGTPAAQSSTAAESSAVTSSAVTSTSSAGAPSAAAKVLAPISERVTGQPIDGISADTAEKLLFHIHAHLAIYVDGQEKLVPYGIGIVGPYKLKQTAYGPFVESGSKYYWLHTHDETGIIHIESPVQRSFTLGNFFDIWQQPLGPDQVGPARGPVTVFVDGKQVQTDPRTIELHNHEQIQLDVGKVVAFKPYDFHGY
ncbi:hypothetical protein FOS14_17740 [Skermania sp. ID1734]|uniref:hypothetical protein n=1 Tax=Skermania sp. ID1734 TaxID=2597516 RepID=UPI00117D4557|nr:hypothetical protein [Skermania sp. ID1734]TSD95643.1 hypothetical protein FOS14_17740 [Skermania sp. ID1734]